jgi:tetratricopeptide (TPR) repeat protein
MSLERASATVRLENALLSYGVYLWNTFWPVHLAVFHPLNRDAVPAAALAAALALCAAITVTALFLRRSRPYVLVGWLWYVGTLVPVIGLVQVGSQARADRYTYIPLIGIFLIVSWGLADLAQYLQRRLAAIAVAAAALAGCVVLTWVQIGFWQDSARLWRHALEVNPVNPRAHASLAAALAVEGKGKLNEAVTHYLAAVNQSPDLRHERLELARLLAKLGKDSEAVSHYETAIRAGPDSAAIENAMGASLSRMGHEAAAAAHYEQALRLDPGYYPAHFNLGLVLDRQDRLAEAAGHYSEALRLESHYEAAAFGLAGIVWKVATGAAPQNAVDSSAAVRFGETASAALADRDPLVLEALAAAYAHAGDYAHAVPTAERALALTADPRQLSAARRRLELYRHHEPCRDATAAP